MVDGENSARECYKKKLRTRIDTNVNRHAEKEENNYSRFGATLSRVIVDGGHVSNLDKLVQVGVCLVLPLYVLWKLVIVLWSSPVLEHARFVHRYNRLEDGIILQQGETCVTLYFIREKRVRHYTTRGRDMCDIIFHQGETCVTLYYKRERHV